MVNFDAARLAKFFFVFCFKGVNKVNVNRFTMAKRSQKCSVQYEKDQSGCMWSLISIFDIRHGRSARKLLPDRRHGSKHFGKWYVWFWVILNMLIKLRTQCLKLEDWHYSHILFCHLLTNFFNGFLRSEVSRGYSFANSQIRWFS